MHYDPLVFAKTAQVKLIMTSLYTCPVILLAEQHSYPCFLIATIISVSRKFRTKFSPPFACSDLYLLRP